jgi:hypothetical protein
LPALVLVGGCSGCWTVDNGGGSAEWNCGPGVQLSGCDGDAALLIGALYLAIAIPYLIAQACRSCP